LTEALPLLCRSAALLLLLSRSLLPALRAASSPPL
jgi:hypothetical protein